MIKGTDIKLLKFPTLNMFLPVTFLPVTLTIEVIAGDKIKKGDILEFIDSEKVEIMQCIKLEQWQVIGIMRKYDRFSVTCVFFYNGDKDDNL